MKLHLDISFASFFVVTNLVIGSVTSAVADGARAAQAQPTINCTCRYKGQDFQQGDMVCLSSPSGPQMARCGFVQNNTSWNFTGIGCLYSSADPDVPAKHGQTTKQSQMMQIATQ